MKKFTKQFWSVVVAAALLMVAVVLPIGAKATATESKVIRFIDSGYLGTLMEGSKWGSGNLKAILVETLSDDLEDTSGCTQVWRVPADEFENIHEWCKENDKGPETNQNFLFVFGKYMQD